jgi:hypothetical protein
MDYSLKSFSRSAKLPNTVIANKKVAFFPVPVSHQTDVGAYVSLIILNPLS